MLDARELRRRVKPLATLAALAFTAILALAGFAVLGAFYILPPFARPPTPSGPEFVLAGALLLALTYLAAKGAVMAWMRPVWQLASGLAPLVRAEKARVRGKLFPFRAAIELLTPAGVVSVEGLAGRHSRLRLVVRTGDRAHDLGTLTGVTEDVVQEAAEALHLTPTGGGSPASPDP